MTQLLGPSLLLLALVPSALATIISDGGFACIFNANGVAATPAQRGLTAPVPALSTLGPYDTSNLGCAPHTPPTAGGAWPLTGTNWCILDQTKCSAGSGMCGTLYPGFGYVDTCDNAQTVRFGIVPNTQILDPVLQSLTGPGAYVFYSGQRVTIYIDRNQPKVLADELLHIWVTNPSSTTCIVTPFSLTSGGSGYNINGTGATALSGGGNACGNGGGGSTCAVSSSSGTMSYTVPNPPSATATSNCNWGLGAGVTFNVAPGLSVCNNPGACQGVSPRCVAGVNNLGTACPPGSTNGLGVTKSGNIQPAVANATITVLPSTTTNVDIADPLNGDRLVSTPSNLPFSPPLAAPFTLGLGALTTGQTVHITFTATGLTAYATKAAALIVSGCGGGGGCITIPNSTLSFYTAYSYTYPGLTTLPGANTVANGGAMNFTIPANIQTAVIPSRFGNPQPPQNGAAWAVSVTISGITAYSRPFNMFLPPPTPTPSPSTGSSVTSTPSPTPTASISRGSSASSSPTPSGTSTSSATSTTTATPTISDTSRPSTSAQPDLAAIARQQQQALLTPVVGAVGGILFLLIAGGCAFVIRQRQLRMEARMRMKASSRRFMGAQTSAYGNVLQDGAVHLGAARERAERPAETTVMFQVALPQGGSLPSAGPGGIRGGGGKRPARSNSMNKR